MIINVNCRSRKKQENDFFDVYRYSMNIIYSYYRGLSFRSIHDFRFDCKITDTYNIIKTKTMYYYAH